MALNQQLTIWGHIYQKKLFGYCYSGWAMSGFKLSITQTKPDSNTKWAPVLDPSPTRVLRPSPNLAQSDLGLVGPGLHCYEHPPSPRCLLCIFCCFHIHASAAVLLRSRFPFGRITLVRIFSSSSFSKPISLGFFDI